MFVGPESLLRAPAIAPVPHDAFRRTVINACSLPPCQSITLPCAEQVTEVPTQRDKNPDVGPSMLVCFQASAVSHSEITGFRSVLTSSITKPPDGGVR